MFLLCFVTIQTNYCFDEKKFIEKLTFCKFNKTFFKFMDLELIREYCLSKSSVTESTPFDETTLVFKVLNKIFCLLSPNPPFSINLKCLPEKAIELREEYEEIRPGFHMNKKHWNTVELEGNLSWELLKEMIDDSYRLVVEKMPKKDRGSL